MISRHKSKSKSKKRKSVPRVYRKSIEEIKNEIRKYGHSDSTIIELSSAAIKKRDACNQYYDRAYGECKRKGWFMEQHECSGNGK